MKDHITTIINIWCDEFAPKASKKTREALADTLYSTFYQYLKDSNKMRKEWNNER